MRLHLGVIDVSYGDADASGANTTGEVAEILEDQYHVMATFIGVKKNMDTIDSAISDALTGAFETAGTRNKFPVLSEIDMGRIEERFRDFLSNREFNQASPGTDIAAAKEGVSHRFKSPKGGIISPKSIAAGMVTQYKRVLKAKRSPRPEFIDSGLYQASFRSWLTQ